MSFTDGCVSAECKGAFAAVSSLPQGETFAKMTSSYHGGRRSRRSRRRSRRVHRMRGGSAAYPTSFDELLPQSMHAAADISSLDKAFAQLPEFAGKYGMSGGRRSRRMRGGVAPALQEGQNAMILSPAEEGQAFLNPQWYTENQVVPSFRGPASPYVASQKAGSRRRKHRKTSRKSRKASRKSSRKMRGGRRHRRNATCTPRKSRK